MRDISSSLINLIDNNRVINGRFTIRDPRLIFTKRTVYETMVANKYNVDSCVDGTGIIRVAKKTSDNTLQYMWLDDPMSEEWDPWAQVGSVVCHADSSVGIEGSRCWYLGSNKKIYYVDWNSGTEAWGTPVEVLDASGWNSTKISFAPVDTSDCYVLIGPQDTPLIHSEIKRINSGGSIETSFHGFIYGNPTQQYRFDAVRFTDRDHVYVVDRDDGRALYTAVSGLVWSDLRQVVPLDVIDDTTNFKLGGVAKINSQAWVTGRYTRGTGIEFDMYSIGPDYYTMGRNIFITHEFEDDIAGKFILIGSKLYFLGYAGMAHADASILVGYDNAAKKDTTSDIINASADFSLGNASSFDTEVKSDLSSAPLRRGSWLDFDVGYKDGETTYFGTLGRFGIDAITPVEEDVGSSYAFGGRGLGHKTLDQWESDQSYDYWSQAKMSSNPADLTDMARTTGIWDTEDSILTLDQLNVDGWMYSVARYARGSSMRARFRRPSTSDFNARYGVGVNYYRETMYEASERLGVDPEDVTESQYGHNGIFAVWENGTLYVIHLHNSQETQLDSTSLAISADTWHWLQILFQDGYIRVLYREDGTTTWSEVLETKYQDTSEPWFRDDMGRGAIYVLNETKHGNSPGFNSTSVVIPIDSSDISEFPASETVMVDDELITYGSKATAASYPSDLEWAEGQTFTQAPHGNNDWEDILLYQHSIPDEEDEGLVNIGKDKTECVYACQAFKGPYSSGHINTLKVRVKKTGTPTDNLYCYYVTDDWDETSPPAQAAVMSAVSVAPGAVGTDFAWVEFDFTGEALADRDFDPAYGKSYWFVITTMPDGNTNYDDYHDVDNYYVVQTNKDLDDNLGLFRMWKTSSWFSASPDAILPFQLYGKGAYPADAYELYINEADSATEQDAYQDCALVCTEGPGAGEVARIMCYDAQAPDQWVPSKTYNPPDTWDEHVGETGHGSWVSPDMRRIFIDRRISLFGVGSKFTIYPSLVVDTRGYSDTTKTSHGAGFVNVFKAASVECDKCEYHSAEPDMRLEDMTRELVAKAGITDFTAEKDLSGEQEFTTPSAWNTPVWRDEHRNVIFDFTMPALDAGEKVGLIFRADAESYTQGYRISIDSDDNLTLEKYEESAWSTLETVPMPFSPEGTVRISVQVDGHFSVWCNERFVHAFVNTLYTEGDYVGITTYGVVTVDVDLSAVDQRIDNFILDMGVRGTQLLNSLIGAKRAFVLDTPAGGLRMAKLKISGDADFTVPDVIIFSQMTELDTEQRTMIRTEGYEIAELADYDAIQDEGLLFGVFNAREANDLWEGMQEAEAYLKDMISSSQQISIQGAADPRAEPNDIITATIKTGDVDIVVDKVTYTLDSNEDRPQLDMKIGARYAI